MSPAEAAYRVHAVAQYLLKCLPANDPSFQAVSQTLEEGMVVLYQATGAPAPTPEQQEAWFNYVRDVHTFARKIEGAPPPQGPTEEAKTAYFQTKRPARGRTQQSSTAPSGEVGTYITIADEIIKSCEELRLSNESKEAETFSNDVEVKVESMRAWMEQHDKVTDRMKSALTNMQAAVKKWLDRASGGPSRW